MRATPASLDRRDFLRQAAVGVVGAGLAGCADLAGPTDTPGALSPAGRPRRVVVVGAGLAGMVAGYELSRAGHDVIVLEARRRTGGRVFTLRAPFATGHYAEAGAARIPPEHHLTLDYASHFGLALDPFYPESGLFLHVAEGQRQLIPASDFRSARPDYVKVRGGSDGLTGAFADALGSRIVTSSPVTEIAANPTVRVTCSDGSVYQSDFALVTVPVPLLGSIRFTPPLSAGKAEAVGGGFGYQSATRVFVRFAPRFWEAPGLNGWGTTDWPEELWHPTWDVPGPEGVLMTYVRGERANELDGLDAVARAGRVIAHWEEFLPGAGGHVVSAVSHSWQLDPWSRAAWARPTAVQDARLMKELARPEGPLHFAGEHISSARGWMHGALESGLRAAREIHGE